MRVTHRLVLVLGLFGGLFMAWVYSLPAPNPVHLWMTLLPLALAAVVIYPIAWVFRRRGSFTYRVLR